MTNGNETTQNNSGIVYILTNDAMPGMVKIGKTTRDIELRMKDLYCSGVPLPFECYYAKRFDNYNDIEKNMHNIFSDKRINMNREFFEVEPERIVTALQYIPGEEITKTIEYESTLDSFDKIAVNKSKKKKTMININEILNVGDVIYFKRDETITATVMENNKICFNGEITSLSKSARELLGSTYAVQGTIYWMYNGETLNEIRRRKENEEE